MQCPYLGFLLAFLPFFVGGCAKVTPAPSPSPEANPIDLSLHGPITGLHGVDWGVPDSGQAEAPRTCTVQQPSHATIRLPSGRVFPSDALLVILDRRQGLTVDIIEMILSPRSLSYLDAVQRAEDLAADFDILKDPKVQNHLARWKQRPPPGPLDKLSLAGFPEERVHLMLEIEADATSPSTTTGHWSVLLTLTYLTKEEWDFYRQ
jgi:hypothetical protein